jgi:peroxiredoxin Q/BCP
MTALSVGDKLPTLTLPSSQGDIDLGNLGTRHTVLYFYPKDSTPGCTTESQDFRDRHAQFLALDCQIIGVSRDSLKSHANFTEKQSLPFALIADTEETLCQALGVIKMKNMYGKQVRGIERSTFLVDGNGVIAREWRGVRVPGHADTVLQAVQAA